MSFKSETIKTPDQSIQIKALGWLILAAIIFLGAFLRFYQLGASSIGNAYYAAAVKSMLTSWPNFFFRQV